MKLGQKGISRGAIDKALNQNAADDEGEDVELKAALILARRRKLGCFRMKPADAEQHRKDLATLARAGFSLDIARRALRGEEEA